MIILNEFPEFQSVADRIDSKLGYPNLIIKRGDKDDVPHISCGEITINDTDDAWYFGGELTHEVGHLVFAPITPHNFITYVHKIKNAFGLDLKTAVGLENIISDIIIGWKIKDDPYLNLYRRRAVEMIYKQFYNHVDPLRKELFGLYKRFHGCRFRSSSKLYKSVKSILSSHTTLEDMYIGLAQVLLPYFNSITEDQFTSAPFKLGDAEVKELAQKLMMESNSVEEAKDKIEILSLISNVNPPISDLLYNFFESKANQILMSIEWPKRRMPIGVMVGSKRWRPEYGWKMIDHKRTLLKYGVGIPLVTLQAPRTLNNLAGTYQYDKPCDLVVSIDCSGSTGIPEGAMNTQADYMVVMFYALVNVAKRIGQRIGLTLWSERIIYSTLPDVLDWRGCDQLKHIIISRWSGGYTSLIYALEQARQYHDKLFFVFTDGDVSPYDLLDVKNVVFFLVRPSLVNYIRFKEKYGEGRVFRVDSLDEIPRVTVQQCIKLFVE